MISLLLALSATCVPLNLNHVSWTILLKRFVRHEVVDFKALKETGQHDLNHYVKSLGSVCASDYEKWSKEDRIAFWLNAYNASAISLIAEHYPVDSIESIGKSKKAAFQDRFVAIPLLKPKTLSLDEIENHLRKGYNEPRIHFALFCGAASCPILDTEAYVGSRLNSQLERATSRFVNDIRRNRFNEKSRVFKVSQTFNWYRKDFEKNGDTLASFLAKYVKPEIKQKMNKGSYRIEFVDYNWCLTGRCPLPEIE